VKPDAETLLTVPTAPPAAGPDRAFDPAFAVAAGPDGATLVREGPLLLEAALLLEVALTMANATTASAMAATPIAMVLMRFRENMR
jgi:hypothetical protein